MVKQVLYPDQTQQFVGPDLGPNCLQTNYQQTRFDLNLTCAIILLCEIVNLAMVIDIRSYILRLFDVLVKKHLYSLCTFSFI